MMNCVECGAPLERAAEACEVCGAIRAPGTLNGKHHHDIEDEDAFVYEREREPRLERADPAPEREDAGEPGFVERPLEDDPTLRLRPFKAAGSVPVEVPPAGFTSRAIAMLVDLIVLSLLDVVLFSLATAAVVGAERVSGTRMPGAVDLVGALLSAGSMTLALGYFSVLQARTGQTLGKAALGIRVESTGGTPIGIARSVVRTLGYVASALPFGAGFLLALGPARRTLHDRLAGTVVARVRRAR